MNRIESLNLTKLHNNEHFQFMTDVDVLIAKCLSSELGIDVLYPNFKQALAAEEIAIRVESGSSKSKILTNLDIQRDQTYNAITIRVKSALLCPFDDEIASGQVLQRIIDQYGDFRSLPYNEESASITNFINDLLKPENVDHLEKVCIRAWVQELKNENDEFQAVFNDRNQEFAGRESGDVRISRRKLDPIYLQMAEKINATFVMEIAKPAATAFATELNEKISYYKTTLAIRIGHNKAKDAAQTTVK